MNVNEETNDVFTDEQRGRIDAVGNCVSQRLTCVRIYKDRPMNGRSLCESAEGSDRELTGCGAAASDAQDPHRQDQTASAWRVQEPPAVRYW